MSVRENSTRLRTRQTFHVRDDKKTDRDHEDDANDISLISWFCVIQEVPIDMKNCQTNGSKST